MEPLSKPDQILIKPRFLLHRGSFHFGSRRSQGVPRHRLQFRWSSPYREDSPQRFKSRPFSNEGTIISACERYVKTLEELKTERVRSIA